MSALQSNHPFHVHPTSADEGAGPNLAPIDFLFGAKEAAPAPAREVTPAVIRYQRRAPVYALDGPVGVLRQIVLDEDRAEVRALVVQMTTTKELVLAPPELVDKSVGGALLLNVTREQFSKGAARSPRFEHGMFTRARLETVSKAIPLMFRGDLRRSVVGISQDQVETTDSIERANPLPEMEARRPWWKMLSRRKD